MFYLTIKRTQAIAGQQSTSSVLGYVAAGTIDEDPPLRGVVGDADA